MRNFAIVRPFKLNWKYAVPHDYDRMEYFITPRLSMLFHQITNGQNKFNIGSFILQKDDRRAFADEVLPQRSDDRIKKSFENENISAFFTKQLASDLDAAFEKYGFICRQITVLLDGYEVEVESLPEEEFQLIMDTFVELNVVSVLDFEKHWEDYSDTVENIRTEVTNGIRREDERLRVAKKGFTKKVAVMRGAIGTIAMSGSVACMMITKKFMKKGGFAGFVGASVSSIAAFGLGVVGKMLATDSIDYYMQGMVKFGV